MWLTRVLVFVVVFPKLKFALLICRNWFVKSIWGWQIPPNDPCPTICENMRCNGMFSGICASKGLFEVKG